MNQIKSLVQKTHKNRQVRPQEKELEEMLNEQEGREGRRDVVDRKAAEVGLSKVIRRGKERVWRGG